MDDAFLRAIRADPEADLPRLVYADWLDEHDDPARAEFVRVQCELAKLPDHDPAYAALEDREHELLAEHEAKWLGDGPTPDEWAFRRGFVDELRLDPADPPPGEWLTRQAVTSVTLAPRSRQARAEIILTLAGLEGLREVDARPAVGVWGMDSLHNLMHRWDTPGGKSLLIAGLRGAPTLRDHFSGSVVSRTLRRLQVGGEGTAREDYMQAQSQPLHADTLSSILRDAPLETLHVQDARLTSLAPLLSAGFAGSLSSLDVSYNPLGPRVEREFAETSGDLKLKHLDISGTNLLHQAIGDIIGSQCCETLTSLGMNDLYFDEDYEEWLLDHPEFPNTPYWGQAEGLSARNSSYAHLLLSYAQRHGTTSQVLRSLDFGGSSLRLLGAQMLTESPWARTLTWLNLAGSGVRLSFAWHLAQADAYPHLRTLHLGYNNFEPSSREGNVTMNDSLEALVNSASLSRLRVLTLTHNPVTDVGVELLMNAPHFTLSGLGLSRTQITAAGVRTLAKSPRLARLNWLDLSDNAALHSGALLPLAESPYLSPLCDLDITRTGASVAVRDLLRQRLGRRLLD